MIHISINNSIPEGFNSFFVANRNAIRDTLNISVANTRKNALENIKKKLTLRNQYTQRSIVYDKVSNTNDIDKMEASIGAKKDRAFYLEQIEESGIRKKDYEGHKTGATGVADTNVRIGKSDSQVIDRKFFLNKIHKRLVRANFGGARAMAKRKVYRSKKARSVAEMIVAIRTNKYIVRGRHVIQVLSLANKSDRSGIRFESRYLYKLEYKPIHVKKREWLKPATEQPEKDLARVYVSQLKKQWKIDQQTYK